MKALQLQKSLCGKDAAPGQTRHETNREGNAKKGDS